MAQMVESINPGATFLLYENPKGKMVDRVSTNSTILCSNVWFVWNLANFYDTLVCHTLVRTVYDFHATSNIFEKPLCIPCDSKNKWSNNAPFVNVHFKTGL